MRGWLRIVNAVVNAVVNRLAIALAYSVFFAIKQVRSTNFVEWLVRGISFIVRNSGCHPVSIAFLRNSLLLKDYQFDFVFRSRQVNANWTASGFPDLLTRHMMFEGMYQQDVLVALQALIKRGDIIYDVGGHHGLMAIVSAAATGESGRVVTFEPNPHARVHLEKHLALNPIRNVAVENLALSDKQEEVPFFIQTGDVSWNSTIIGEFANSQSFTDSIVVQTTTLDDYVSQHELIPSLIKIDVEGSEFKVLNGARRTIQRHRPALIMEFNPIAAQAAGHSLSSYCDFLNSQNYRLLVLQRNVLGKYQFGHQEPFVEAKHTQGDLANVICVPA